MKANELYALLRNVKPEVLTTMQQYAASHTEDEFLQVVAKGSGGPLKISSNESSQLKAGSKDGGGLLDGRDYGDTGGLFDGNMYSC
jgi:hypothetical protein